MKQKFKSLGSVLERKDLTTVRGGGLCNDQCGNTGEYCQICVFGALCFQCSPYQTSKKKA